MADINKTVHIEAQTSGFENAKSDVDNLKKSTKELSDTNKDLKNSTDNVVDAVTKNGGAMAILNKLTGGLAGNFKNAYEATKLFTKSQKASNDATDIGIVAKTKDFAITKALAVQTKVVTAAQWLWNAALTANPIGAIIVAATALLAALTALGGGLYFLIKRFNDNAKANEDASKAIAKTTLALNDQSKAAKNNNDVIDTNNKNKLAMAKASGASAEELRKLSVALADEAIKVRETNLEIAKGTFTRERYNLALLKTAGASKDVIAAQEELLQKAKEQLVVEQNQLNQALKDKKQLIIQNQIDTVAETTANNKKAQEEAKKAQEKANQDAQKEKEKAEQQAEQDDLKKLQNEQRFLTEKQIFEDKVRQDSINNIIDEGKRNLAQIEFDAEREERFIKNKYAELLKLYEEDSDEYKALQKQKETELKISEAEKEKATKKANDNILKLEEEKEKERRKILGLDEGLTPAQLLKKEEEDKLKELKKAYDNELITLEEFLQRKKEIEDEFKLKQKEQAELQKAEEEAKKVEEDEIERQGKIAKAQEGIRLAQESFDVISGLLSAQTERVIAESEARLSNLDKQIAEEEAKGDKADQAKIKKLKAEKEKENKLLLNAQKKAFKQTKAFNIVNALINGALAVTNILATVPGGPLNPAAIASIAIAATTTATNVAKIARQKFEGGETGGETGGDNSTPTTAVPDAGVFGTFNTQASRPQEQSQQQQIIKAVVVQSDITSTTNRLSLIENGSEL